VACSGVGTLMSTYVDAAPTTSTCHERRGWHGVQGRVQDTRHTAEALGLGMFARLHSHMCRLVGCSSTPRAVLATRAAATVEASSAGAVAAARPVREMHRSLG
jgi:hypothetical protein